MKHVFLINRLEKLNLKKDSSLFLAAQMKKMGHQVSLWFEDDFFYRNQVDQKINVYDFEFEFLPDGFYLKKFNIQNPRLISLASDDIVHWRLDPPFDSKYLRQLWMLKSILAGKGRVLNSVQGILQNNEKLLAYEHSSSLPSFVGDSVSEFKKFVSSLGEEVEQLVIKPIDRFQGDGVIKCSIKDGSLVNCFEKSVQENAGPIVAQAFCAAITKGEIRTTFFAGQELGSILKVPAQGDFLANVARGAQFHAVELPTLVKEHCQTISRSLMKEGIYWIAFDVLDGHMSEVNITCPGLLVETSFAHQKNLAKEIADQVSRLQ